MSKKLKKKLICVLCHLGVFVCLYLVTAGMNALATSISPTEYLYLFGWTTHESYWGLWLLSPVLVLLGQNVWAWFVTGGNVLAVLCGQFLGDWIEGMMPPDPYGTRLHSGFLIWAGLVLVSILLGGFVQFYHSESQNESK